jgi:glycogenin glucosyltransferase
MWYKVPDSKPQSEEKPKPIFPWEQEADRPRPTRVFADDLQPEPTPASPTHPFSTVHYDTNDRIAPGASSDGVTGPNRPLSARSADEGWQAFQQSNGNAWDNVPGIENYVRNIMESHGKRNKIQSLKQTTGTYDLDSPLLERRNRRESLILTDFPTAVERPSLPVTPAPIRRPSFWGEERDQSSDLPGAEGVEDQAQWVCPQCGFSSVKMSAFNRRHDLPTPPVTSVVASALSKSPLPHDKPSKIDVTKPSELHAGPSTISPTRRSGFSFSGVPLASLTDPDMLL